MKLFYFLIISLLIISVSCEDPNDVGAGIIPTDDALLVDSMVYTDVIFNNFRDDSILHSSLGTMQLGRYENDVFGVSNASIYTELYFDGTFNRLENAILDSLVLYLSVSGFQGDSLTPQTINVFELTDTLKTANGDDAELYYIFEDVSNGGLLTSFNNITYTSDSTLVDTTLTSPHIRTTISGSFAESLFTQLNDSTITTSTELQAFFKGFLFEPEANSGDGWFEVNINNSLPQLSGLYFYYHNDDTTFNDVLQIQNISDFQPDEGSYESGSQSINQIINTYSEAEPQLQSQIDVFSVDGNPTGYLQGGNGTYLEIDFEDVINSLPDDIHINLAELTIKPTFDNLDDTLYVPTSLILAEEFDVNDEGEREGGILRIDGTGFPTTVDFSRFDRTSTAFYDSEDEEYLFFLPRSIQSMIDGLIDPTLILLVNDRAQSINGIKFGREDLELKLFYTKIE